MAKKHTEVCIPFDTAVTTDTVLVQDRLYFRAEIDRLFMTAPGKQQDEPWQEKKM